MLETHVIRKYANRKLYDTHTRRYVTLDRIRELLREGHEVRVIEQTTGDDITALTLSQVLLDMGRQRNGVVPEPVLVDLVKERGEQLLGVVRAGLNLPRELRQRTAAGLGGAATKTSQTVESRVDDVVAAGLRNLNIATAEDVAILERRIESLATRVEELLARQDVAGPGRRAKRS